MREIRTSIDIAAAPSLVWGILTDFPAYPSWNPFIRRIEGEAAKNARLTVEFTREGKKPMTLQPTVLVCRENRELRWLGKFIFSGIFDGEHFFELESRDSGRATHFTHGEMFTGILVDYFAQQMLDGLDQEFHRVNKALKVLAEAKAKDLPPPEPEAPKRIGDLIRGG